MTDYKKYDTIKKLIVEVDITKRITRHDIIMQLLNENEVAFKGENGSFIMNTKSLDDDNFDVLIKKQIMEKKEWK